MARSDQREPDTIHAQLRNFVRRIGALLSACDQIERDGLVLVPDEGWIEVYRLLIEVHELLVYDVDATALSPHLLRLDLKLAVLEALVETAVGYTRAKVLH